MEIVIREKNEGPSVHIKKNGETVVESGRPVEAPVAAPVAPETVAETSDIKKVE